MKNPKLIDWEKIKSLNGAAINEFCENIISEIPLQDKLKMMSADGSLMNSGISMAIRYNKTPIPAGVLEDLGIPGIKFADGPRGIVVGNSTCFPVSMARGASWDRDLERRIGNAIGIEGRSQGANYFGGVCINLLRHPAWGRAQETYGEDPYHLGEMGVSLMKGVQNHLMACAKHYACNSMENARFKVNVKVDERTLREVYLPHFKKCVDNGVASIMNAYNKVNGKYCGHNPHLLTDILKNDWGFRGFVITDFVLGIRDGVKAVNAGVDIEMPFKWRMKPKKLMKYLEKGLIKEESIDDSVLRILRTTIEFEKNIDPSIYSKSKIACEEHVNLALEAARKSMVLLKNDNDFLPLDSNSCKNIVVMGKLANMENTGDHGSSRVYPPYVITPLEGIKRKVAGVINVIHEKSNSIDDMKGDIETADAVVIVVGYTHKEEGEFTFNKGGDRDSIRLKPEDERFINEISKLNKKCVVIVETGSAIILEAWKDNVPSVLIAWYPGMEGGTAIADILFGDFNPCGKLPVVFPTAQHKLPYFDKNARAIEYGYYHGYKLMEKVGVEVAFPFGFGLSYTTYEYENLQLDTSEIKKDGVLKVSIDVKNTGTRSGEEIVQLYVGYPKSNIDRPVKELKGFERVSLNTGEKKTVSIELKAADLAYYDVENKSWNVLEGNYTAFVGASSQEKDLINQKFSIIH